MISIKFIDRCCFRSYNVNYAGEHNNGIGFNFQVFDKDINQTSLPIELE